MSHHHHLLVPQLLRHIVGGGARDLDPRLGEEGTGGEDEDDVEEGVHWVRDDLSEAGGGGHVVGHSPDRTHLAGHRHLRLLPAAQEVDEDVLRVPLVEDLGDEVQVGHQRRLEDDRDVGGVEELDRVVALGPLGLSVLHGQLNTEALEVNHQHEHQNSSQEIGHVGQVLAVECLLQSSHLVLLGSQQVEKRDEGSLELGPTAGVDGGGAEGLPDDVLAHVGGDEERDRRPQAVALLQELVEADHDDSGSEELADDEDSVSSSQVLDISVHSRENVGNSLNDGDDDSQQLLSPLEQCLVLLGPLVNINDLGASQELHNKTGSHDRADSQLHESSLVGGKDDTHPIERVRGLVVLDSIERDLAAHEVDEERDGRP
mmetsp:Transcript_41179/g.64341  ORF Transcript_41179/g.64341 Transcript_41179/m.64341 type:complete len:373 (-) Transcript_41179:246-1364(-)